jgi:hypothetical protein
MIYKVDINSALRNDGKENEKDKSKTIKEKFIKSKN